MPYADDGMTDFFMEKFEEEIYVEIPEAVQHEQLSEAIRLLTARKKLAELNKALQTKKAEFQLKMTGIETRRAVYAVKEHQIQKHLAKFDKYIRENDMKSAKAVRKAQNERAIVSTKLKELDERQASATNLTAVRDQMKGELEKHTMYVRFLEGMVNRSEEFSEIRDVISRYETLSQTHKELSEKEMMSHLIGSRDRRKLTAYIKKKNSENLSLNGQLSSLLVKYDKLKANSERLENQMAYIENTAAERTVELGKVRMSTHAMYHLILKHSARMAMFRSHDVTDPIEQLDQICTYIMDVTPIVEEHAPAEATSLRYVPTNEKLPSASVVSNIN